MKTYAKKLWASLSRIKLRVFVAVMLLVGFFCKRGDSPTALIYSLTPDQVYFNSTPEQVLRFFREDRFSSLANFDKPLVEVRTLKTLLHRNPNFTFDAPLHILCRVLYRRDYSKVFRLANSDISGITNSSSLKIRKFKEKKFDPILYAMVFSKQSTKIDLITTQTSLFKIQEVFKYSHEQKKIMAWYSTNSKPIYALDDLNRDGINVDAFKDFINEHWVWNQEDVEFLQSNGIDRVIPVGPIVFQDKVVVGNDPEKFVITYFDVTPLQGSTGFYSEKNVMAVLNHVLKLGEIISQKYPNKTIICIKPKRQYFAYHSKGYIATIKTTAKMGKIRFLSPSSNLYETITKSDLVIAIPFTSPALIAKELKVKQYFISTGIEGWDLPESSSGVDVVSHFPDLLDIVEAEIRRKFNL
jgi:hypothetical protein